MGDGVIVIPTDGQICSPVNGEVMMVFPTKHAIGIKGKDGEEILIHIGMDTVSLDGKPFTLQVEQGAEVKAGQPLIKADLDAIKAAGLSIETPMIITNQMPFDLIKTGSVKSGDIVMKLQ